jgi:hypothetical protein
MAGCGSRRRASEKVVGAANRSPAVHVGESPITTKPGTTKPDDADGRRLDDLIWHER